MSTQRGALAGIELDGTEYEVVQSLIRNKYKAYDAAGNLVLKGKQKMLKAKEEFPFHDAGDDPVFTVKAGGILDISGDYTLTDEVTGEPVVVLDNNFTLFNTKWKIRDPDTEALIAKIESKSTVIELLRSLHAIFSIIPHEHEIMDDQDNPIGRIKGKLSLKDQYTVNVDGDADVPTEAVVAAAMVVDAIEDH